MNVQVLHPDQVWDVSRTCFFPTMEETFPKEKFRGETVLVANKGTANERKFIVVER